MLKNLNTVMIFNFIALINSILVLILIIHLFNQRPNVNNILAWVFAFIFIPYISVPVYFLFGNFKNKKLIENKNNILKIASNNIDDNLSVSSIFNLLENGQKTYEAFCNEIKRSKKSISIMTYIITKDHIGKNILELLVQKAKEGVDVKFLVDGFGSLGSSGRFLQPLRDAGGKAIAFMPISMFFTKTSINFRNHRKMAIFDEKRAIVGGQNIDQRFLSKTNNSNLFHDFSVIIEGHSVSYINCLFMIDWSFASKQSLKNLDKKINFSITKYIKNKNPIEVIASGPDYSDESNIFWEKIIKLIQKSKYHIDIITPYFVPDEVLFQTLLIKAKSGHSIRIIIPKKSNQFIVDYARHYFLRELHNAGVKILFYEPSMLHAKLLIIDSKIAIIGSSNIDVRSMFINFEINFLIKSDKSIKILQNWLNNLLLNSIVYDELKINNTLSLQHRICENIFYLFVPLL